MIARIFTIAANTFTESIRQPIYLILLILVIVMLVLTLSFSAYTFDEDTMFLIEMSLSMVFMAGLAMAVLIATSVLAREISNKTVLTVISKPIGRPTFILGKFLGVAAAVALAFWCWSLVMLMTVRHEVMSTASDRVDWVVVAFGAGALLLAQLIALWGNYFYNWSYTAASTALSAVGLTLAYLLILMIDKHWQFQAITTEFTKHDGQAVQVVLALLLVFEALLVITAIAIACATRAGVVVTLVVCVVVIFLGITSDYMLKRYDEQSLWVPVAAQVVETPDGATVEQTELQLNPRWPMVLIGKVGYRVVFNVQFLYLADALMQRSPIVGEYVVAATGYALLYTLAVLCLAVALFQTRETG